MSASLPNAGRLTALAFAGLAHQPKAALESGELVDTLVLPGEDVGRDLLLRAGALAIYRVAGRLTERDMVALEPAPGESRPVCSAEAAALIDGLIVTGRDDLLTEAFERMERRGDLLPPALLPAALNKAQAFTTHEMREALAPVMGERGRWLARHNPSWSWALERTLPGERGVLPPDSETIWQEGTSTQRVALLARLRSVDPALARDWLNAVWKKEKAEMRASLLETFATGLAAGDEPFLEAALDDRGERVRTVAANLLASLPGSALVTRIRARAEATLTYIGGKLDANPPKDTDATWTRDGLPAKVSGEKGGQRASWLEALLERVPPAHWSARFIASPEALIAACSASTWRLSLLAAWTAAAARFGDRSWAEALWDAWLALPAKELSRRRGGRVSQARSLAPWVSSRRADDLALQLIAEPTAYDDSGLSDALDILPHPWSDEVARAYLTGLRAFVVTFNPNARDLSNWMATLAGAALALPESAFTETLEPFALVEGNNYQNQMLKRQLEAFGETIHLRERLVKVLQL